MENIISENAKIADTANIIASVIEEDCIIGENVTIGPFAYIRKGTTIMDNVHIGSSVEIKNSTIGENTHIGHLAYIGDATIGKNCNIGAGVKFANFDGRKKHKTIVEDDVFIGCNSVIIAPAKLSKGTYIGAMTTYKGSTKEDTLYYQKRDILSKKLDQKLFDPDCM